MLTLGRGIVTACTAAVSNTGGLYACRFMLGLVSLLVYPKVVEVTPSDVRIRPRQACFLVLFSSCPTGIDRMRLLYD